MKKNLSFVDFTVWGMPGNQYVDWAELKAVLGKDDYLKLIKFVSRKKVPCPIEGLPAEILQEFLHLEEE